jgi:pyruvate dehydrogenase E1 component alpha subunit
VSRARSGAGASLVETKTYRFENHAIGIPIEHYRDAAEVEDWKANRDPLPLFREVLLDRGLTTAELDQIENAVADEVQQALEFARSSPMPPLEDAFTNLFTNPVPISG